jgi:hypothetical protein
MRKNTSCRTGTREDTNNADEFYGFSVGWTRRSDNPNGVRDTNVQVVRVIEQQALGCPRGR